MLGLTDELKVLYVNPGLAADRAGLRPGDIVLGSGNWRAPRNANALAELERIVRSRESQGGNVPLLLRRGGQVIGVTVNSDTACDYAIVTSDADAVNAFADGRNIIINRGMLRASRSDKELAVVLAHEIGHNAVKHLQAKRSNATAGFIFGAVFDVLAAAMGVNTEGTFAKAGASAGAQAHSPQYEIEADYVGLYIMARAKYDFSEAPNFWRQMAVLNPKGIAYAGSHPTYPHRFVAMEIGVREIQGKLERGDVIMPDMGPPPAKVEPQPADEENCAAC